MGDTFLVINISTTKALLKIALRFPRDMLVARGEFVSGPDISEVWSLEIGEIVPSLKLTYC